MILYLTFTEWTLISFDINNLTMVYIYQIFQKVNTG